MAKITAPPPELRIDEAYQAMVQRSEMDDYLLNLRQEARRADAALYTAAYVLQQRFKLTDAQLQQPEYLAIVRDLSATLLARAAGRI